MVYHDYDDMIIEENKEGCFGCAVTFIVFLALCSVVSILFQ